MHCAGNEKLLALHAGGDLPARQARALSAHLRACEGCRRAASDFSAGRELLGAHEPPEFDAAFFDRIRRNVLREIDDATPPPPAFARLTSLLLGRRALALAACVVFLVAVGAIAPRLRGGRGPAEDAPRQLAGPGGEERREHVAASDTDSAARHATETEHKAAPTVVVAPSPRRKQLVAHSRRAPREKRDARSEGAASSAFAEAADAQSVNAASPRAGAAPASEVAVLAAPAERKMLRIELQTGDPNVRIIWLSPQGPDRLPR